MSGLTGLMDTARSALLAHQQALQITGNNVANVNTEGYSRQRLDLQVRSRQRYAGIGAGVEAVAVRRLRMESFDRSYRAEASGLGSAGMRDLQLAGLEAVIGEPGYVGLGDALDRFWSSWGDLANEPAEDSYRQAVVEAGHSLSQHFQQLDGRISAQRTDMNLDVERIGNEINQLSSDIAELNSAISQAELGGSLASDLRDQRDMRVDQLASLTDIQFGEDDTGTYRVWLSGRALVDGVHHAEIDVTRRQDSDGAVLAYLEWSSDGNTLNVNSGELAGVLDVRDRVLPDRLRELDALADALAEEVNSLHRSGYTLDGNPGSGFFSLGTGGAGGLSVRSSILEDPALLAASADGGSGNGDQASAIAGLAETGLSALGGNTVTEEWSLLVSRTGSERQTAALELEAQQIFVSGLDERRLAVSGVNLDEELTIMMEQEQAYAAAARVISVADELITTVLQLVS